MATTGAMAVASLPKRGIAIRGPGADPSAVFEAKIGAVFTARSVIAFIALDPAAAAYPAPPAYKAPVPITSIALRPVPPFLYFALVSRTASSHFQSPPPQRLLTSNCTPLAGKAWVIVLPSFSTDLVALLNASVVCPIFNLT